MSCDVFFCMFFLVIFCFIEVLLSFEKIISFFWIVIVLYLFFGFDYIFFVFRLGVDEVKVRFLSFGVEYVFIEEELGKLDMKNFLVNLYFILNISYYV